MTGLVLRADACRLPLADASVDAICTDPPYGLEFMGKDWDKPSMLGQLDRFRLGEKGAKSEGYRAMAPPSGQRRVSTAAAGESSTQNIDLSGPLRNATDGGVGRWPSNCALSHAPGCQPTGTRKVRGSGSVTGQEPSEPFPATYGDFAGRVPFTAYADADGTETVTAWTCEEGCPVALLDRQSGETTSSGGRNPGGLRGGIYGEYAGRASHANAGGIGDQGGASRFFYTAKAAPDERVEVDGISHPTQKPLDLVRWLVRLITPPGGIVLDPFAGSFTTAEACMLEGFRYICADRDPIYVRMAAKRTNPWTPRQHRRSSDQPTLFEATP
jgi:hypothetical protein